MKAATKIPRAPSALEERLWFIIVLEKLPRPEREFKFHPHRKWRFDFAYPDRKVAIECEGGTWSRGRHTRGSGFEADCEKYNAAAILGWKVLRLTSSMIDSRLAVRLVTEALQ